MVAIRLTDILTETILGGVNPVLVSDVLLEVVISNGRGVRATDILTEVVLQEEPGVPFDVEAIGSLTVTGQATVVAEEGTVALEAVSSLAVAGSVVVSVDTLPVIEDFSGYIRDSNPLLTSDFALRSLSASESSVALTRIRRAYNATGGQVLELFHTGQLTTHHTDPNNGVNFLVFSKWDDYGLVCFECRFSVFFKQLEEESGNEHFAGFGLNRFGTNYYDGGGFVALVKREELLLRWLGQGGGFSGAVGGLSVSVEYPSKLVDGEGLVLIVTRGVAPGTVYRRNGEGDITSGLELLPAFSATLFREQDGSELASVTQTFNLYSNLFDAQNPGDPDLPLEGECGFCYSIHEGYVHLDYVLASAEDSWSEPQGIGQLASPVILAPTFGELATTVKFRQVDRLLDEGLVCLVELVRGVTTVELHNGVLLPDADGVRTLALNTAGLVQARDYRVRVTTSLTGLVDSEPSMSDRFTVDRSGETRWTPLLFDQADANPAEFPPLYNNARALFYPRTVPSTTDGRVLLHRNNALAFGAAAYWNEAPAHVRRAVFSCVRLHTVQSSMGVALRAIAGASQWAGYGFYLVLRSSGSLAILQRNGSGTGGNTVRDTAALTFVPGALYTICGQTDGAVLAGKCWRGYGVDDEPGDWQVKYTSTSLVPGLAGLVGMGEAISQGIRRREYDSFGVTGLDELPDDLVGPQAVLMVVAPPCLRLATFTWTLSGDRIGDLTDVELQYEVYESDVWVSFGSVASPYVWNTAAVSPGQYRARLVAELDGAPIELAVSSSFFMVANGAPFKPTIVEVEELADGIRVEIEFDDPNLATGDFHAATRWKLLARGTLEAIQDTGWQTEFLVEYTFPVVLPEVGYVVVVEVRDQCSAQALNQRTQAGTFWECAVQVCPPPAEPVQSSTLWLCGPLVVEPSPEEPPPPEEIPEEPPETPLPYVASVEVLPSVVELAIGAVQQFTARALTIEGEELFGRTVSWTSGNVGVVLVNGAGLATASGAGVAQVYATCEGVVGFATVSVLVPEPPPPPPDLENEPPVADFTFEEV